jgi:hypothetical protein
MKILIHCKYAEMKSPNKSVRNIQWIQFTNIIITIII